jgi:hypothetical protein
MYDKKIKAVSCAFDACNVPEKILVQNHSNIKISIKRNEKIAMVTIHENSCIFNINRIKTPIDKAKISKKVLTKDEKIKNMFLEELHKINDEVHEIKEKPISHEIQFRTKRKIQK